MSIEDVGLVVVGAKLMVSTMDDEVAVRNQSGAVALTRKRVEAAVVGDGNMVGGGESTAAGQGHGWVWDWV